MPEIAEVHRFVDQLTAHYGGHDIVGIEVLGGRFVKDGLQQDLKLIGFPLNKVKFNVKGKFIYWTFNDHLNSEEDEEEGLGACFLITLGMTGSFGKQNKHSAIKISFDNGDVFYNDIRHFGTFKVEYNHVNLNKKLKSLGWDCLLDPNPPKDYIKILRKKFLYPISQVMMDQKIFAGLGNYLRSEILYAANINPFKIIADLSDNQLMDIAHHYTRIAKEAESAGGATIATYTDMYGIAGSFYDQFKVYGKKKDPLGNDVISCPGPDGRTIHWVKEIQL